MRNGARNTRPPRRRRESARPFAVLFAAILTLGIIGVVTVIGLRAPSGLPLRSYDTLYASFYDSGNLQPRNEVRIRGVRVGQVIAIKPRDGWSVAELQLDPDVDRLPRDTTVLLRAQGLLGARYVELIPGRARATLPDGAQLDARPNALTSGVPETLETFDARTRGGLGKTLRGLGTGLLGRGQQLNHALRDGVRPATQFPRVTDAIVAGGAAARLSPSLQQGAGALDAARDDIAGGIAPAADALTPFAARRDDLGAAIEQAPPTLDALRAGLGEGGRLLRATGSLARAARDVLPVAPAGLREATTLLRESRRPLGRATRLLQASRPAIPPALRLLDRVPPLLPRLRDGLADLIPIVATLGQHGCDIDNFAENWRSALGFGLDTPSGGRELPSGRIGPVQGFRILVISGAQLLHDAPGTPDVLAKRTPYPTPCEYSPGARYPLFAVDPTRGRAAR